MGECWWPEGFLLTTISVPGRGLRSEDHRELNVTTNDVPTTGKVGRSDDLSILLMLLLFRFWEFCTRYSQ